MSFFIIFGFGLNDITSKPNSFKFSILCFPISVIPAGSELTSRQRNPRLSRAVIACFVLSLPPLTPITQS